jgi:hypothetical protein
VTVWSMDKNKRRRLHDAKLITAVGAKSKWTVLDEEVLQRYSRWVAVCDAHPDKEDCEAFAKRYPGRFWMGFEKDRPEQPETAQFSQEVRRAGQGDDRPHDGVRLAHQELP